MSPEAEPAILFPARAGQAVRVDSLAEEQAYLSAYPSAFGPWEVVSQTLSTRDGHATDRLVVCAGAGAGSVVETEVLFDVSSFVGTPGLTRLGGFTTEFLDRLTHGALEFARSNVPLHPGTLPRFPVPSAHYPGRVDVPLALLAVDAGRRGLFAPPLVVTLDYPGGAPFGVGDFPGFRPADWPPPRLGDWPPPAVAALDRVRLQGTIARFSGCVTRLLDAWLGGADYAHSSDDVAEAFALLAVLDLPAMLEIYERLNAAYVGWLSDAGRGSGPASGSGG